MIFTLCSDSKSRIDATNLSTNLSSKPLEAI
jgi:hypothetical protein